MKNCKNFNICAAPICLQDPDCGGEWYPGEEICTLKQFARHAILISQKKILKKTRYPDTYYTRAMLNKGLTVGKNIRGINPDTKEDIQIETWHNRHPARMPRNPQSVGV